MSDTTLTHLAMQQQVPSVREERRCAHWFWGLIITQLVCWTLAPLILLQNSYYDILEQLVWGRHWQLGYDKDPMLGPWLMHAASQLTGGSIWVGYLLSQLCVVTALYAVWRLALRIVTPRQALAAVFILVGIYYYNVTSPEFNDNMLLLASWALTSCLYYAALQRQTTTAWLVLAVVAALTLMAKYYSGMLLLSMLLFVVFDRQARQSFKMPGFYVGAVVFLILVAPNLIWLVQHQFVSIGYAFHRGRINQSSVDSLFNHLYHPLYFFSDQLAIIVPSLVLFALFFVRWRKVAALQEVSRFDRHYLLIMCFGPLLLTLLFSLLTGAFIRRMWGTPLFNLLGIVLVVYFRPQISARRWRWFVAAVAAVFVYWLVFFVWDVSVHPYLKGKGRYVIFPGQATAQQLTQRWHAKYRQPLHFVAGNRFYVMNIANYSTDKPVGYFDWQADESQWIKETQMRQQGALFVWHPADDAKQITLPAVIHARFPLAQVQGTISVPWDASKLAHWLPGDAKIPAERIAYAFLPPQANQQGS